MSAAKKARMKDLRGRLDMLEGLEDELLAALEGAEELGSSASTAGYIARRITGQKASEIAKEIYALALDERAPRGRGKQ